MNGTGNGLDAAAIRAFSGPRVPKFLATRDAEGVPNVVPVLSLEAVDERTIIFGEMMIWKTRRNLEADARLSILVLTPDLRRLDRPWPLRRVPAQRPPFRPRFIRGGRALQPVWQLSQRRRHRST